MRQGQLPHRQTASVPLRLIDTVYGRDSVDNAADDIVFALRTVSAAHGEYPYRFVMERSDANPWYHVMIVEVEGMPDREYQQFMAILAGLGLVEQTDDPGPPAP